MPTLVEILQIICLIPIISGCIYLILSVWTIRNFFRKTTTEINATEKFQPPVTVLKPIRGIEKNLKSNLHTITIQDWPEYQVIYSIQDPQDSALPILDELQAEVDNQKISVVIDNKQAGANGKVNNLLGAIAQARHQIIIISDSDTNLKPDYIKNIISPLSNPNVGAVCTLFKVKSAYRWFEKMELLTINADFIPSVIFAAVTGASNACLGPSIAISRSTLQELGGLESLADYLVEDYELGRRVWTSGKKMVLLPYTIDVTVDLKNWQEWWTHQVYWDQNTYLARPWPFIATILIRAVPFAILFAIVRMGDLLGLGVLGFTLALRLFSAGITLKELKDVEGFQSLYLLPLRDTFGLIFWFLALTKRTVVWRGVKYKLVDHGKMVPVSKGVGN
ncbi:glycosyl transferase, family 2 [Trichodesmium erythraeum IMS101]|uniref:Glycosyl transferase, family 2 n=1 Tax=Trichodesmium erythraeum (strain IMS101) TaxID=203124 RepID=Q10V56_TRIEI|nr:glycosyltransferase [Trichodesmium erythraeum GBRTRLIN201]MDE5068070.1 glycosyltransferase [Trichodesmium sp. St4_bin8_1]MDT9342461.1 glycosyltransferase [Trichodesmium erythraeum 21-75]